MSFKGWDEVIVETSEGLVRGVAPVIISASRSTDIPAFYSQWFIQKLRAGYVKWTNPFNRKDHHVSFEKTRVIVFWTKNAEPMMPLLPELDRIGLNYYFTFTVNDYQAEFLEPGLPSLEKRIETFKELSRLIGRDKVLWRYDPLILSGTLTVEKLLEKVQGVGERIHTATTKLIISFADIAGYRKVANKLRCSGHADYREFSVEDMRKMAIGLEHMNRRWKLEVATCAEDIDLAEFGIKKNRCVDDELMAALFGNDRKLMEFLGRPAAAEQLFGVQSQTAGKTSDLKDKGQRKQCGCIASKDIGSYNTCMHLCAYCYANCSREAVRKNSSRLLSEEVESV